MRLVGDYHAFERALRAVYAAGGRLAVSAAEAHAEADLGGLAGHQVLAAIASAQAHIGGAIGETAGGHRQLELLGRRMGYDVTAYGDGQKPPSPQPGPSPIFTGADGSRHVVDA